MSGYVQRWVWKPDLMYERPTDDQMTDVLEVIPVTDHEPAVQAARDGAVADNNAQWVLSITEEFSPGMTVAEMVEFLGDPAYSVPSLEVHDAKVWNDALDAAAAALDSDADDHIIAALRKPVQP